MAGWIRNAWPDDSAFHFSGIAWRRARQCLPESSACPERPSPRSYCRACVGSIVGGLATPTEVAGADAVGALVLAAPQGGAPATVTTLDIYRDVFPFDMLLLLAVLWVWPELAA